MTEAGQVDIRIRRTDPRDAGAIASVMDESFREYKPLYTPEAYAVTTPSPDQVIERMGEGPLWVAMDGDRLVGTASVVPQTTGLYIRGMAILPAARGRRIGWLLLEEIERFAVSQEMGRLFLSTTPFLDRAISLYEHYGFQRIGEGPYDLRGTPLFTMEKRLQSADRAY